MQSVAEQSAPASSIHYEVHIYSEGVWLRRQRSLDRRSLSGCIDEAMQEECDAVRLVRVSFDRRSDYEDRSVIHAWPWWGSGIDFAMPAVDRAEDIIWHQAADVYGELARYQLNRSFSGFLKARHLCVEELLHHPAGGRDLGLAWQNMQTGIQPIALQQAGVLNLAGPECVRQLTDIMQRLFTELERMDQGAPVPAISPDNFAATMGELHQTAGEGFGFAVARALSAHLADATSYTIKLARLSALCAAITRRADARPLDWMLASLFKTSGMLAEIAGGRGGLHRLLVITRLYNGSFESKNSDLVLDGFNELMAAGYLPRARGILRRRLIEEVFSDPNILSGNNLMAELSDIDRVSAHLEQMASSLVGDPELAAVWQWRISNALTPESLQRVLVRYRLPIERLGVITSLFPMMRGIVNRDQLGRMLAAHLSFSDLTRELIGETKGEVNAIQPLLKFYQRLSSYQFDASAKDTLLTGIDDSIIDLFRVSVLPDDVTPSLPQVVSLLKIWLPTPLKEGRAMALVREALAGAIEQPEFFNLFWDSFRHEKVRAQAQVALEALLRDYDLKSPYVDRQTASSTDNAVSVQ